jgi:ligand-binding sensor domain-containing protein
MIESKTQCFLLPRDKNGNYYFGTRNGLFKYANDTIVELGYQINSINDITVDANDKLWLSTNSGIFIYNPGSKELKHFRQNEEWANQIIQTIYFDFDGNIWIGTYRKGVLQVRIGGFQNFSMSSSGISEVPSALVQVNDSTIWIGTDEGNIYSLTKSGYKKVRLKTNLNNSRIKSIFIDSKKNTWVCSYYGLLKINNGSERILNTNTGFTDNTIRELLKMMTEAIGWQPINQGLTE